MKSVQMSSLSNPFHYKRTIELKKQHYEYRVCVSHCVIHHIHTLKQEELMQTASVAHYAYMDYTDLIFAYICVFLLLVHYKGFKGLLLFFNKVSKEKKPCFSCIYK